MSTRSFKLAKILGATGTIKATALDSNAVGGGVKLAENDSADLGTGAAGDLKFASNRKTLHLYDGTEWERIAGGQDADPVVITDASEAAIQSLSTDSHRQTFKVADPEGFPISYSISYMRDSDKVFFTNDSSNLPPPLAHPAIITKATDGTATYRFLTRTTESDGSGYTTKDLYKARYMGSDGARQVVSTKDFKLQFAGFDHENATSIVGTFGTGAESNSRTAYYYNDYLGHGITYGTQNSNPFNTSTDWNNDIVRAYSFGNYRSGNTGSSDGGGPHGGTGYGGRAWSPIITVLMEWPAQGGGYALGYGNGTVNESSWWLDNNGNDDDDILIVVFDSPKTVSGIQLMNSQSQNGSASNDTVYAASLNGSASSFTQTLIGSYGPLGSNFQGPVTISANVLTQAVAIWRQGGNTWSRLETIRFLK